MGDPRKQFVVETVSLLLGMRPVDVEGQVSEDPAVAVFLNSFDCEVLWVFSSMNEQASANLSSKYHCNRVALAHSIIILILYIIYYNYYYLSPYTGRYMRVRTVEL